MNAILSGEMVDAITRDDVSLFEHFIKELPLGRQFIEIAPTLIWQNSIRCLRHGLDILSEDRVHNVEDLPLFMAIAKINQEAMQAYLRHGANPNQRSLNNRQPLGQLIKTMMPMPVKIQMAQALIDAGANPWETEFHSTGEPGVKVERSHIDTARAIHLDELAEFMKSAWEARGLLDKLPAASGAYESPRQRARL